MATLGVADISFSLDLIEAAQRHLQFLENARGFQELLEKISYHRAVQRYEQLWLPIAKDKRSARLAPPSDISWIWYCHTLSPVAYRRDCRRLFSSAVDHSILHEDEVISGLNNAIEVWYAKYQNEPFNVFNSDAVVRPSCPVSPFPSRVSVDLAEFAKEQMNFCYQVALPHFKDRRYLENALIRYKNFLLLKRINPTEFLVPSVDVLLMWYTHMAHPKAYKKDTTKIVGELLENDVKLGPDDKQGSFQLARENTRQLWKRVSSDEMIQPGTFFRGKERTQQIYTLSILDEAVICITTYRTFLNHIELRNAPKKFKKFFLDIFLRNADGTLDEMLTLKGPSKIWNLKYAFVFNPSLHKGLEITLRRKRKVPFQLSCLEKDTTQLGSASWDIFEGIDRLRPMEHALSKDLDLNHTPFDVGMDLVLGEPSVQMCHLALVAGQFLMQNVAEAELSRTWGLSTSPKSSRSGLFHQCYIADHKFHNHEGRESFRCLVMHCRDLLASCIQVFYQNKLVATSNVIGASQLPRPEQVEAGQECVTFDPTQGERAMLIKNHNGDWGVCVGKWLHQDAEENISEEHQLFRFRKTSKRNMEARWKPKRAKRIREIHITHRQYDFQSASVDLKEGKISINPTAHTVPENLALVMSMAVLQSLCTPSYPSKLDDFERRTRLPNSVEEDSEDDEIKSVTSIHFVNDTDCALLKAAGLGIDLPNNEYLQRENVSLTDTFMDSRDIVIQPAQTAVYKDESIDIFEQPGEKRKKRKKKKKHKRKDEGEVEDVSVKQDMTDTSQAIDMPDIGD